MDRAVLYLRQSITREDSISLELQETACRNYCTERGYEVVAVEPDPGISGGTFNRPGVQRTMRMIEARQANVIVLWKWSRLSRKRLDWYVALDAVEQAGGRIESATEQIDTTTSVGRLSRGVLVELAAFERERISDQWKEVLTRRRGMGLADAKPRLGYIYDSGVHTPDPERSWVVTEIYRRFGKGEASRAIAADLNRRGIRTSRGNVFKAESIREVVAGGFGAGLLRYRGIYQVARHEAVVDAQTWELCLLRLQNRPRGTVTSIRHTWSGLLRCARCGKTLHAASYTNYPPGTRWICPGPKNFSGCTGANAWAPTLSKVVEGWLRDVATGSDREFQEALKARPRVDRDSLTRARLRVEEDLLTIARKNNDRFYDDDTYLRLRAELKDKDRLLRKALAETEPVQVVEVQTVLDAYLSLPDGTDKNTALRTVLRHVVVRNRATPKYTPIGLWVV